MEGGVACLFTIFYKIFTAHDWITGMKPKIGNTPHITLNEYEENEHRHRLQRIEVDSLLTRIMNSLDDGDIAQAKVEIENWDKLHPDWVGGA